MFTCTPLGTLSLPLAAVPACYGSGRGAAGAITTPGRGRLQPSAQRARDIAERVVSCRVCVCVCHNMSVCTTSASVSSTVACCAFQTEAPFQSLCHVKCVATSRVSRQPQHLWEARSNRDEHFHSKPKLLSRLKCSSAKFFFKNIHIPLVVVRKEHCSPL